MYNSTIVSLQQYFETVTFCDALEYTVPSLLSAVSTAIVLIVSVARKFWTRPLAIMIVALNLGDLIYFIPKVGVLVRDPDSDMFCVILQAMGTFGITLSASWAALFGHAFYRMLKEGTIDILSSLLKYYLLITCLLPVVTGSMIFFTPNIRLRETGVCVYRVYIGEFDLFVFFNLQLPMILSITLCILFYILSLLQLRKIINKIQMAETLTLMMYPAILVICWTPLIGMQVAAEFGVKGSDSTARTLRIITHLMGFLDALVYGEGMKGSLRGCLKACQKKKKRRESSVDELTGALNQTEYTRGETVYMSFQEPKSL